jgi:hypothetical protein
MSIVERLVLELGPWIWWIVGLVLLGLEVLAPGTFFLWFGLAAIVVGTIAIVVDIPWQLAVTLFGVLSVGSMIVGRLVMRRTRDEGGDANLNQRGKRMIGREFVLAEPMRDGSGSVRIDDTVWRVSGPDCPAGTRISVTGVDGATLTVAPVRQPAG